MVIHVLHRCSGSILTFSIPQGVLIITLQQLLIIYLIIFVCDLMQIKISIYSPSYVHVVIRGLDKAAAAPLANTANRENTNSGQFGQNSATKSPFFISSLFRPLATL